MKRRGIQRKAALQSSSRRPTPNPSIIRALSDYVYDPVQDELNESPESDQDASILLVGIRGTGKTSLAILASSCIQFRLIDADQHFHGETGLSRAEYASKHGFEEYRKQELTLMRELLQRHPSRCIIVCGPGSAEGTGQELLKSFKKKHPVIFIMRDPDEVDQYLRTDDAARISKLCELISPSYRSLSNFEFWNLSESLHDVGNHKWYESQLDQHPSLTLKHVEEDFSGFLQRIRNQGSRPRMLQARHSLSFLPPERKPFTYALTVPIEVVSGIAPQFRSIDFVVDAIELVLTLDSLIKCGQQLDQSSATYITRNYYMLRRSLKLPVIIHVQESLSDGSTEQSSGESNQWSDYSQVLLHALRLAPEYLTLDLDCEPRIAKELVEQKGSTKIIGHFFESNPAPGAWDSTSRFDLLSRAKQWQCDLVRITQRGLSQADNLAVQHFAHRVKKSAVGDLPLIAYNVGQTGRASCFLNSLFTPVTHDLIKSRKASSSEGALSVQEAQNALYSSFSLDKLEFLIYGSAVTAAMSPAMHNAAFKFCGMPHVYRIHQASSLNGLQDIVSKPQFGGASITSPFKLEIISVLDYLSPEASAIGAVNTLIPLRRRGLEALVDRNRAGSVAALFGDNTDWIGIYTCIQRNLSPINAVKGRTSALILGAGGMARAAMFAAIRLGVQTIFTHNRTIANAEKLAKQFDGKTFQLQNLDLRETSLNATSGKSGSSTPSEERAGPARVQVISSMDEPWPSNASPPTIIVSCIPLKYKDHQFTPEIILPDGWLTSRTGGVVVELSYKPLDTPLLQQVRALKTRGWIAVHGLQVMPEQGIAQFELFTGRTAPQHTMRAKVAEYIETYLRKLDE